LQSSQADQVNFRIAYMDGEHSIHGLRLDYDARQLLQGQIHRLQAESIELNPQHTWLPEPALIRFQDLELQCFSMQQCQGSIGFATEISRLQIPDADLRASQLSLQTHLDIRYAAPGIQIDLAPGMTATLSDLETPQIKLEQLSLGSEQMWRV